ncbi:MAG: PIG-L family deacetylase [Pseudomonadota bacterium]
MKRAAATRHTALRAAFAVFALALGMPAAANAQEETQADGPPAARVSQSAAPSVLVLLAHPDDEILFAPALARIAREGGEVTLAFATSGDADPGLSTLEPGRDLAQLREAEARCAAFALAIDKPVFWQLGEGTLSAEASEPSSTARALVANIASAITRVRPRVVMTWGPDGGSGDDDHRMVSAAATQVVQALGADRPELIYLAARGTSPPAFPGFEDWAMVNPALITDRIGYEAIDLDAARGALACYESRFDEVARAGLIDALETHLWRGLVHFRLAFPSPY